MLKPIKADIIGEVSAKLLHFWLKCGYRRNFSSLKGSAEG